MRPIQLCLRALFTAGALLWITACITDVNHPPGSRWVRLFAAAIVVGVSFLEYRRPWHGVYAFILLWPQFEPLRDLLSAVSPLWKELPNFTGAPMAAGLGAAICWREAGIDDAPRSRLWTAAQTLIGVFALSFVLSALLAIPRMTHPPEGWVVTATDFRHLLTPGIFISFTPVLASLSWLTPVLLMLMLLRVRERPDMLCACLALTGGIVFVEMASQLWTGWHVSGDILPIGGPFLGRNTAGPVLLLFGLMTLAVREQLKQQWSQLLVSALAALMVLMAVWCGSRNVVFTLGIVALIGLFYRSTLKRTAVLAGLMAVVVISAMYLPLTTFAPEKGRIGETAQLIRSGNWDAATGYRGGIYKTALSIWREYPLAGSGPGTFPMQANLQSKYRDNLLDLSSGGVMVHAHSVPLHLLAESGPLAALSWTTLFLLIPIGFVVRGSCGAMLAIACVAIGLMNLLDEVWMTPGVATFSVICASMAWMALIRQGIPSRDKAQANDFVARIT